VVLTCWCRFRTICPCPTDTKAAPVTQAAADDDDDDFELFGSDEEIDKAAEKLKQERLAAYETKKATSQLM